MQIYTRDGDKVLNLTGAWPDRSDYRLMTTTIDYFREKDFLEIRSHLAAFRNDHPQAHGLIAMAAQKGLDSLTDKDRSVLQQALKDHPLEQDWKSSPRGVMSVAQWVKHHGGEMPDFVFNVGGRPVMPDVLAQDVGNFQKFCASQPEKGDLITRFMKTSAVKPEDPVTKRALGDAGLINPLDELSLRGRAVAAYLAAPVKL